MSIATAVYRESHVAGDRLCPDREVLSKFMLGQIADDDAGRVEAHLARCRRCVETVETLAVQDALVEAVQSQHGAPIGPISPVVEGMMERLSSLRLPRAAVATDVRGPDESTAREHLIARPGEPQVTEDVYDFLSPPDGSGEIGQLGSYRVRRLLGAGGMGLVFLADDPQLHRPVALKVMRPTLARNDDARRRFMREAQAAAALQHDHIVTIY
jgi:hypothetical protein